MAGFERHPLAKVQTAHSQLFTLAVWLCCCAIVTEDGFDQNQCLSTDILKTANAALMRHLFADSIAVHLRSSWS